MVDRTTGEPIVLDLSHAADLYRTRYRFPFGYLWECPGAALAALSETMPWEALVFSLAVSAGAWLVLGSDLGIATGLSVTLALVTLQMLRTRDFATPFRIVRQRGLFILRRADIPLAAILDGHVEYPCAALDFIGDIVLVTAGGTERIRAVRDPRSVLGKLLVMRTSGSAGLTSG